MFPYSRLLETKIQNVCAVSSFLSKTSFFFIFNDNGFMKKKPTIEDYDSSDIGSKSLNLELERLEPSQIMLHPFFLFRG